MYLEEGVIGVIIIISALDGILILFLLLAM